MEQKSSDNEPADRVSGLVERVTFHSEESGFAVLKVKVRGQRSLATVVGTIASVSAGEWLEASGRWIVDPAHGAQLRAKSLRTEHPSTKEGMEKYLASGAIKGIGKHFAALLVEAFGLKVFEVIEHEPDRLLEVEGIGAIRKQRIVEAWLQQKAVQEIMIFLHAQGVGTSRAFRIYKVFGDKSIDIIRENPYRLAREIWGIGFKIADRVAENLGIGKEADIRAQAGVEFVLRELTDAGHCAYPRTELVSRASEILEISEPIVEKAIQTEVAAGELKLHRFGDGDLVYLSAFDLAEQLLAQRIISLGKGTHPLPHRSPERVVDWVEQQVEIKLSSEQKQTLSVALSKKVLVVTGGPGVGKTTLINCMVKIFQAGKLKVRLAAPTGRAAKRMMEATGTEARTIHRLLEFDPRTGGFKHDQRNPLKGDVFIVDEVSMIDLILGYQLIRAIPDHAALVLVGDVDQLPSVGPGAVLSDLIDSKLLPVCRLSEIYRQAAESSIIINAHRINSGRLPLLSERDQSGTDSRSGTRDFFFVECTDEEKAVDLILRLLKERIPKAFGFDPVDDVQVLSPMLRGTLGARNLNLVLQAELNPSREGVERFGWRFCCGDKVMQVVNNYQKDVFNGDLGRIQSVDPQERELAVRFDQEVVTYQFDELDELALAYCTTIHKSQGSEFPCVVVPVHTQHFVLLQRNLLYTAVTRGKKLVVLVGTKKALSIAIKNNTASRRITTLKERLRQNGFSFDPGREFRLS